MRNNLSSGRIAPLPADAELVTFDALRRYYDRVRGFTYPEAELRQQRSTTGEGHVGEMRVFPAARF